MAQNLIVAATNRFFASRVAMKVFFEEEIFMATPREPVSYKYIVIYNFIYYLCISRFLRNNNLDNC